MTMDGHKDLEITDISLKTPDRVIVNGKIYTPEYNPECGEVSHIMVDSYACSHGYVTGTFVGQGWFLKIGEWSPRT